MGKRERIRRRGVPERVSARRTVRVGSYVRAQRSIESAAERKGASVGPEDRTERSNEEEGLTAER